MTEKWLTSGPEDKPTSRNQVLVGWAVFLGIIMPVGVAIVLNVGVINLMAVGLVLALAASLLGSRK